MSEWEVQPWPSPAGCEILRPKSVPVHFPVTDVICCWQADASECDPDCKRNFYSLLSETVWEGFCCFEWLIWFLNSLWSPSSCPNVSSMFSVGVCQRENFGRGEQIASREKESEQARGWITALFLAHVPHECSACNGWPRVHLLIGVFKSSLVLPTPTRLPQAQIGPFKHLNVKWHSVLVFLTKKKIN